MQEVNSSEPFLEAWPSIIIMTLILRMSILDQSFSLYCEKNIGEAYPNDSLVITTDQDCANALFMHGSTNYDVHYEIVSTATFKKMLNNGSLCIIHFTSYQLETLDLPTKYCTNNPENEKCSVFGGPGGSKWFFTTYSISVLSCAFGIARFLQLGPFSVLSDEGPLRGVCSWRFLMTFFAIITSIISKGYLMTSFIFRDNTEMKEISIGILLERLSFSFAIFVLPNIIFSIMCFSFSTGVNRKLFELILSYPASWMLPVITNFAIGPRRSLCKLKANHQRHQLAFSATCRPSYIVQKS